MECKLWNCSVSKCFFSFKQQNNKKYYPKKGNEVIKKVME